MVASTPSATPAPPPPPQRAAQRVYRSYFTDSTHWDWYEPRAGDIVISTPPKVGTTWTQRITSVLVFQSSWLPAALMEISPWLDCTFVPQAVMRQALDEQRHRRFIKTHLPMDALPIHPEVSYLVVGRDLRDAALSTHNHGLIINTAGLNFDIAPGAEVHTPEQPIIPDDPRQHWRDYFTRSAFPWESNGWPYNSPTHHTTSWWEAREEPNVLLLHYQDMLDDLDGQMRRIAAFLGIPVDESRWPELVDACTFSAMKSSPEQVVPAALSEALPGERFFHKGMNGRWRGGWLSEEDMALYEAAAELLPDELRAWLCRSA